MNTIRVLAFAGIVLAASAALAPTQAFAQGVGDNQPAYTVVVDSSLVGEYDALMTFVETPAGSGAGEVTLVADEGSAGQGTYNEPISFVLPANPVIALEFSIFAGVIYDDQFPVPGYVGTFFGVFTDVTVQLGPLTLIDQRSVSGSGAGNAGDTFTFAGI